MIVSLAVYFPARSEVFLYSKYCCIYVMVTVCYQGSKASLVGFSERRLALAPLPCHQGKGVARRTRGSGHGALSNVQGDQLTTATNPACPYPRCACPWLVHHIVRLRSMHTCLAGIATKAVLSPNSVVLANCTSVVPGNSNAPLSRQTQWPFRLFPHYASLPGHSLAKPRPLFPSSTPT